MTQTKQGVLTMDSFDKWYKSLPGEYKKIVKENEDVFKLCHLDGRYDGVMKISKGRK